MAKLEYDKEAKAVYITLIDEDIGYTKELVPDVVMIDYTSGGEICGIEVLGVEDA